MNKLNKLFHRDVFLSTLFTYAIIGLLGLILRFETNFLNPLYKAIEDFQFTDIYYSTYKKNNKDTAHKKDNDEERIYLVNIADANRDSIAKMLKTISAYEPMAIGLDVSFSTLKSEKEDSLLRLTLHGNIPVILASQFEPEVDTLTTTHSSFGVENMEGYGNFLGEKENTVRFFYPFRYYNNKEIACFPAKILEVINANGFAKLKGRNNQTEIIHYSEKKFNVFEPGNIRQGNDSLNVLKGKYVMMGYMGPGYGKKDFEDIHLTPLNKSYGGHSVPDMYGVQIHAHVLAMMLDNSYIYEPSKYTVWLITFIITLFYMYFFMYYFVGKRHMWFHGVAKFTQLISFIALLIVALYLYGSAHTKIEPALLLLGVVLSVDALYFMDFLMKLLNRKFNINTYFIQDH